MRSGHTNFSESSEAVKPLTAEEKEEQRAKLKQKLEERRMKREAEEKDQGKQREKERRTTGQQITQLREDHERNEMKKIAEERRKEKIEEKRLKLKIKEDIARDRQALKDKQALEKHNLTAVATAAVPTAAQNVSQQVGSKKEYTTCRIQFRLSDGQTTQATFQATDLLEKVHSHISGHVGTELSCQLSTAFPRQVFDDTHMGKTLADLKLVPSASLIVTMK